jgi:hypothetical protein
MLHLPPILPIFNDPINRPIDFVPTSTPYDPRHDSRTTTKSKSD